MESSCLFCVLIKWFLNHSKIQIEWHSTYRIRFLSGVSCSIFIYFFRWLWIRSFLQHEPRHELMAYLKSKLFKQFVVVSNKLKKWIKILRCKTLKKISILSWLGSTLSPYHSQMFSFISIFRNEFCACSSANRSVIVPWS